MRPALLAAVLAGPAVVLAQVPDRAGEIVFADGYNGRVRGPWIDLDECLQPAAFVNLMWYLRLPSGLADFPAGGIYQVYASNAPVSGDTCRTTDDGAGVFAGPVGVARSGLDKIVYAQPVPATIAEVLAVAGIADCSAVSGDTPVYVCAQGYTPDGATPAGIATGTMTLSIAAPSPPTDVGWDARDGALFVAWTAPTGEPPAYDYRVVAQADPPDARDAALHQMPWVRETSTQVVGLVNDVQYRVQVYAQSLAGNDSAPAETHGTPSAPPGGGGFWLGCATGPGAGSATLLAVLALLAARGRRR